jgi:UDP-N-acetylmuramate--alanine ligase
VITNVDREHMDHYGTEAALREAFVDFANKVPFYGLVVLCADDPAAAGLAPELLKRHVTYGLKAGDYRGEILEQRADSTRLRVSLRGRVLGEARVRMPGVHYAQNAIAAIAVADFLGVPFATAAEALASFAGVDRRFSVRGEADGVLVVDDYGHHPTEIAATVAAAKLHGRRLVVAFQPHRFSRTADLLTAFAPSLAAADAVVLTDIYAAGEAPVPGVTVEALLATFTDAGTRVVHAPRGGLTDALLARVAPGDLLLLLGAGDVTHVAGEILAKLAARKGRS